MSIHTPEKSKFQLNKFNKIKGKGGGGKESRGKNIHRDTLDTGILPKNLLPNCCLPNNMMPKSCLPKNILPFDRQTKTLVAPLHLGLWAPLDDETVAIPLGCKIMKPLNI